jgi:DNA ligase (NAD+)
MSIRLHKITNWTLQALKQKIIDANKAYRIGRPIMSDQEFDEYCELYQYNVSPTDWDIFRNSLHEETGKVKHPYVMGSLDKLKIEEPEKIDEWLNKYFPSGNAKDDESWILNVSAKIDGISCRLHYAPGGKLESATTRGDGYAGVDITDKVKYVKGVVKQLPDGFNSEGGDIRGELVITNEDFEPLAATLKNPRNACAGIMGQKDANPDLLKHVTFVAYEIMGGETPKLHHFCALEECGFTVAPYFEMNIKKFLNKDTSIIHEFLKELIKKDYGFPTDGVVISASNYHAEQGVYRPKGQMAVKNANLISAESVLRDVIWEKPSKNGRITPVGVIDPVELDGATVSRVTLNNLDWVEQMNLKIGSKVTVVRSNGVIPKIIEVENDGSEFAIEQPTKCPYCGEKLVRIGVDVCCKNPECGATGYAKIRNFLERIGIKHVSLKTLENLGISDFESLLSFKADKNYKVQTRFENDLYNALFGSNDITIFEALPFRNVAEKTLDKIISFYGWDFIKSLANRDSTHFWDCRPNFPAGVGEKMLEAFMETAVNNLLILERIIKDPRWHGKAYIEEDEENCAVGKSSVCFTGKLERFSRKSASEFAKSHGFDVLDSVSKNLTYLVTNDKDSGSSKNKKAAQLGIKIINEDEFVKLCEG